MRRTFRATVAAAAAALAVLAGTAVVSNEPAEAAPPRQTKLIALTFDDGPSAGTPEALDILAAKKVKATFFLRGDRASADAATVKRIAKGGHAIGNHSYSHPDLTSLDAYGASVELGRTQAILAAQIGKVPTLARAPFGLTDDTTDSVMADYGLTNVMWNAQAEDWTDPAVDQLVADILDRARPGGIILLHEEHENTRAALPRIIDGLRAQGYTFGTISPTDTYDPNLRSNVVVVR
jgi:peptidoglycan/xylan/chitin deacetylase (PgdA/CDA1 family)